MSHCDVAAALYNHANALQAENHLLEAQRFLQRAVRRSPNFYEAHLNLGNLCLERNEPHHAVAHLKRATELRPGAFQGHYNLARAFETLSQFEAAATSFERAAALGPGHGIDEHTVRNRKAAAIETAMVRSDPIDHDIARGCSGPPRADLLPAQTPTQVIALAEALIMRNDVREAVTVLQRGLAVHTSSQAVRLRLAHAYRDSGDFDQAAFEYDRIVEDSPGHFPARQNRALLHLLRGQYAAAWQDYAFRPLVPPHPNAQPWSEGPTDHVVVYIEQGLGDTIHFARYLPLLQERAERVSMLTPPKLHGIVSGLRGIDLITTAPTTKHEYVHLADLLRIFDARPETALPSLDFVPRDEMLDAQMKAIVDGPELAVGICWQGEPGHPRDAQRSVPISQFHKLAGLPNVRLISLQHGVGLDEIPNANLALERVPAVEASPGSLLAAASLIRQLDLVISIDSSLAHLSGTVGQDTWIPLARVPDWRWGLESEETAWYESVRLFRQGQDESWDPVFEAMRKRLRMRSRP